MPTYALLGATGSTGTAIIRAILSHPPPDLTLNLSVRSKSKLLHTFPDLHTHPSLTINIFPSASTTDPSALRPCLRDADVIFACVGTNAAAAGMTLVHDTLASVVACLSQLRQARDAEYKAPTVVQLRSASLNPAASLPWIARRMAWFFFYHIYHDLQRGCDLLVSSSAADAGLLDYVFVDPPSIHDAEGARPTGHKLFVDAAGEVQAPAISYADLGEAFVEVAARRGEFRGKGVFVSATGEVRMTWGPLVGFMWTGLWSRFWG